jgi:hypothetical protein
MPAYKAIEVEGRRDPGARRNISNRQADAFRRPAIDDAKIAARRKMNLVSNGRILANTAFKPTAHRFAEEHNRHPAIPGKFLILSGTFFQQCFQIG